MGGLDPGQLKFLVSTGKRTRLPLNLTLPFLFYIYAMASLFQALPESIKFTSLAKCSVL